MELQPPLLELVQRGTTAKLLLDAQQLMADECIKAVLVRIDQHVTMETMTPDVALGLCHEIAAFRRIVARQKQEIRRGESAQRRLMEETHGNG